jgi:ketosteroid isomerase-like protein
MQADSTTASLAAVDRDLIERMLRDAFETRWREGGGAVIHLFHPDATVRMIGDRTEFWFSGLWSGRDQIREMMRRIDMEFRFVEHAITEMIIDGNKVVAIWRLDVQSRGTGARGQLEGMTRLIVENGLVTSVLEITDTASVKRIKDG